MIIKECEDAVREFLKTYPNPRVTTNSTMLDGYVTCIKPIPTICNSELMCHFNTKRDLIALIWQVQTGDIDE